MAGRSIERLVAGLDGGDVEQDEGEEMLDTQLVVRDSTAAPCS
jgi:DNA-binding LacI/PurR family transcriptional regulator